MGAISFQELGFGKDPREAFDTLVREAVFEYGNDPYNGTIYTCRMGECEKSFEKHNKTNTKKAHEFAEDRIGRFEKRIANYVCIGVHHWEVSEIVKERTGNKPKIRQKFVVRKEPEGNIFATKDSRSDAENLAFFSALRTGHTYHVSKEGVPVNGVCGKLSSFFVNKKTYKTKPKLKDKTGRKIYPVYAYLFYGLAGY